MANNTPNLIGVVEPFTTALPTFLVTFLTPLPAFLVVDFATVFTFLEALSLANALEISVFSSPNYFLIHLSSNTSFKLILASGLLSSNRKSRVLDSLLL